MARPVRVVSMFGPPTAPSTVSSAGVLLETPAEIAWGYTDRRVYYPGPVVFSIWPQRAISFWMKDTPLALDIVFVDPRGRVVGIEYGEPFSERPVPSPGVVRWVIEVKWQTAAWWGLVPGGHVIVSP